MPTFSLQPISIVNQIKLLSSLKSREIRLQIASSY